MKLIALYGFTIVACTNNQATHAGTGSFANQTIQQPLPPNTISDNGDTLIVYRKAAVFYGPDSLQIANRRQAIGEDDFNAGIEDYAYNLNAVHDFLYSVKLPMLDAEKRKFITFVGINKSKQTILIDTLSELWGVYFFDPEKKARQVDMTVIEEEYKNYFK